MNTSIIVRSFICLRVGFLLAVKEIRHFNIWASSLVVFIMILTFLNLMVVHGVLIGFIEGVTGGNRKHYNADIMITNRYNKPYIQDSRKIIELVKNMPWTLAVTARYTAPALLENNFRDNRNKNNVENMYSLAVGINPLDEDSVSKLSNIIIEGSYFDPNGKNQILIGANLLKKYSPIDTPSFKPLKNISIGSKVNLYANGKVREMIVKGVVKSKVIELDQRIFVNDNELREMLDRNDFNVNEIAIKLKQEAPPDRIKEVLDEFGIDKTTSIVLWHDSQQKFLVDMQQTFIILESILGTTSIIAAAITNFIVIFINAISRRKSIGVLKSIGISDVTIHTAYIIQSFFYSSMGIILGLLFIHLVLKPYVALHPINFPLSNGVIYTSTADTVSRILLLIFVSLIAGYVPAKIVTSQNAISAIRSN